VGDLSRPLKWALDQLAPGMFRGVEDAVHAAIAQKFGTSFPHDPKVKEADNVALSTERRDLMLPSEVAWINMPEPGPVTLVPLNPEAARRAFLKRFKELT
jgi:hypothetical protein